MSDYKKLYRTRDKKICGVCGGIAEYFDLDPTIMRLLWIILAFVSCMTGVIAYLICALVIPEQPLGYEQPHTEQPQPEQPQSEEPQE
ncbi:MAG: PspC domain-containing protein [Bacteroidales bacterium]|nr:PspC domain-containing protein [Bacteroidales bacterium]